MQLNRTTDYVVRIVYFLSNENRIFTSEEISEAKETCTQSTNDRRKT